jgi:transposase
MDISTRQPTLSKRIAYRWEKVQFELLGDFESVYHEVLTPKLERVIHALDWVDVEAFLNEEYRIGRPEVDRSALAKAFIAKSILNLPTTRALIERLQADRCLRRICGFNAYRRVASESTFSRAFDEFSKTHLPQRIHERLVKQTLGDQLIGHIARDATAIEANERPIRKQLAQQPSVEQPPKRRRGRPRKGELRTICADDSPLEKQSTQLLEQMLADIPTACDRGAKCNAQGYHTAWNGYKLHLDTADCGIPINAILSSASMHDSRAALPLALMTTQRISYCYDVMDAAYCSRVIRQYCTQLGHVPLIDHNPRKGEKKTFDPHYAVRYNERSVAERTNSRLKGEFGANSVMVRGHAKVFAHLMFGVVNLTIDQITLLRRYAH